MIYALKTHPRLRANEHSILKIFPLFCCDRFQMADQIEKFQYNNIQ